MNSLILNVSVAKTEFSGNSNIGTLVQGRERGRVRENASESERKKERKRLLVNVKSKQKKFEVAFGERERSSLFAFARTRLLAKRAIRVIRLSGKLYGREGKKIAHTGREEKN